MPPAEFLQDPLTQGQFLPVQACWPNIVINWLPLNINIRENYEKISRQHENTYLRKCKNPVNKGQFMNTRSGA